MVMTSHPKGPKPKISEVPSVNTNCYAIRTEDCA